MLERINRQKPKLASTNVSQERQPTVSNATSQLPNLTPTMTLQVPKVKIQEPDTSQISRRPEETGNASQRQQSPEIKQDAIYELQLKIKQLEMQNQIFQRNIKRDNKELMGQKAKNLILESQIMVLQKELDIEKKEKKTMESKFNLKVQELQQHIK